MPTPAFRLRPYTVTFSATINPTENGTISSLSIGPQYGYVSGNSVLVTNTQYPTNRFEALVTSYSVSAGTMALEQLTNIRGMSFGGPKNYTMALCGERGSSVLTGSTTPVSLSGRAGDVFIDVSTGDLYIKSE